MKKEEFNLSDKLDIRTDLICTGIGSGIVKYAVELFERKEREFIRLLKERFNPKGKKQYYQKRTISPKELIEFINEKAGEKLI